MVYKGSEKRRENQKRYRKVYPGKDKEYQAKSYKAHPEKFRERSRKYRKAHPEKCRESGRKWREANPEKKKEWNKNYCNAHPEKVREKSRRYRKAHPERCREQNRKHYKAHPERCRERVRKHRKTHPEKVREQVRKYQKAHPEICRLIKQKRREKLHNLIRAYTLQEWKDKLNAANGFCPGYECEPHFVGKENLSMDHTPPVSKAPIGFVYTINDINPLCRSCNSRKWNKLTDSIKGDIQSQLEICESSP